MDEILAVLLFIGVPYFLWNYVFFPKERKLREKGYRERYTFFGGPTWWEPDPTKRGKIPDEEWKAKGYRWSEKYHRWCLPKRKTK